MSTTSVTPISEYGSQYSWYSTTDYNSNNGDLNRYYIDSSRRARVYFTTPSVSGKITRIVLKAKSDEATKPGYTRAFLSKEDSKSYSTDLAATATYIAKCNMVATSYVYLDEFKKTRMTSNYTSGNSPFAYFVFNGDFSPNTRYYIYILPYTTNYSESATNIANSNGTNIGFRFRNMPDWTTVGIEYFDNRTLTISGDSGVASVTGSGSYTYGTNATTIATAKTGYHLTSYTGTNTDGSNATWPISGSPSTHTNQWTMNINRTITVKSAPNTYTRSIGHWAGGFKNGEGTNSTKTFYSIGINSINTTYGEQFTVDRSNAVTIPNGFVLSDSFHGYNDSNVWSSWALGTMLTQSTFARYFEMYYYPISYTITYNLNGGTNNSSNPSTYNVLYGVTFATPTKPGYKFKGWQINGSYVTGINPRANATFTDEDDLYQSLAHRTTGNITVTAIWEGDGLVYIDNGSGFNAYQIFIDNGSSWDQYIPYIDSGSAWNICS